MAYYKCGRIYTTQNSNVVVDTASGAVANFQTLLAMPLLKARFDFKATQEAGTPTPQSPKAISGVSAINVFHCGKNLYQYDESKVAIGTTTTATTRAYYPLGFKGVTSLTFSASLKSGSSTTASDYLNIGILRKSDGLLEILGAFITPAGITTRTLAISNDDKVVLMSLENPTVIKSILSRYDIQIEVGANASELEPYNGTTEVIELGGTYYGGHFTQDKDGHRQFVVTHKRYDLSALSWQVHQKGYYYTTKPDDMYKYLSTEIPEWIAERYQKATGQWIYGHGTTTGYIGANGGLIYCTDSTTPSGYLVAPLTEPFTIALPDGQPIKSLPGVNNIFADTGDTSLQFRKIG